MKENDVEKAQIMNHLDQAAETEKFPRGITLKPY